MKNVNCHRLLVCVPAAILWCSLALAEEAKKTGDLEAEIRSLQREQIVTLQKLVEDVTHMYASGVLGFNQVITPQVELLDAKVDGAEIMAERIDLTSKQLAIAEKHAKLTDERFRFGDATALDSLQAKSIVIRIRLSLLKLQLEQKKRGIPKH